MIVQSFNRSIIQKNIYVLKLCNPTIVQTFNHSNEIHMYQKLYNPSIDQSFNHSKNV